MEEHQLTIPKTARYYVLCPEQEPKAVWFVMHGYRQLAKYFIQSFQCLADRGVMIVAPEGLHRFYIEGYSGRVGASWMTREDRLSDIHDYVGFLNELYAVLAPEIGTLPIHLFGFSQGGPTACRWLTGSDIAFRSVLLYATVFPNDFDFEAGRQRLDHIPSLIAFGDSDRFAPEETIREKMQWLNGKGLHPELIRFRGGHELQDSVLLDFHERVSSL